jgi:hypothetical protein
MYLSACWGGEFALRLTRDNQARLKTEIALDELPKTIRDAIVVAQALQIPYVWVDSLCIVQDDIKSWEFEVKHMQDYLSSCTLTLGAASSSALAAGFLDIRDDGRCYTFTARTIGSLPGTKVHLRAALPSVWDSLSRDPLLTRLWTLQELTLCPRSILFGSSRIVWNCRTHMISDASVCRLPPIWNKRLGFDVLLGEAQSTRDGEVHNARTGAIVNFEPPNKRLSLYNAWHQIVETSSQLKVTFERDRLPALSGLASVFLEKLNGDEYIAGLWRNNLYRDLLWHRADSYLKKTSYSVVPSWSWAAYAGRISYSPVTFPGLDTSKEIAADLKTCFTSEIDVKTSIQRASAYAADGPISIAVNTCGIDYDLLLRILEFQPGNNAKWEEKMDSYDNNMPLNHKTWVQSSTTAVDIESDTGPNQEKAADPVPSRSVIAVAQSFYGNRTVYLTLVVEEIGWKMCRRIGVGTFTCSNSLTYLDYSFSERLFTLI